MENDDPLDKKLKVMRRLPRGTRPAAEDMANLLEICWAIAQTAFAAKAKPEHAIQLLPLLVAQAAAEDQQTPRAVPPRAAASSTRRE